MSDAASGQPAKSDSYRDILRSTAMVGASSILVMFFSLLRMKAVALLLGPSGVGFLALYSSIADLVTATAGMGIAQSGVRQIALAEAEGDRKGIARTLALVKRTSLVLGLAGGVGLVLLAIPAAVLTFGSAEYALTVALLGLVVLFRILAGAETAALQGQRRIGDLAWLGVVLSIIAIVVTVPLFVIWREAAIVPSMILTASAGWLAARHFGTRKTPSTTPMSEPPAWSEAGGLLRLGFAFMLSGFLGMGAAYAIRIIVQHEAGVMAAGLYQAAWTISGLYVGVVMQAMGTDFYPRLTAVTQDDGAIVQLVNEQTQVSLLLAGPGVIATITLAHLAVAVFYSGEFAEAQSLLRWLSLGMMLRVVSWPMGFVIIAKGWQKTFMAIETAAAILQVGLAALLLPLAGPDGAGMAFACLYACHGALVYGIVRQRCGFRLARGNGRLVIGFGAATAFAFCGFLWLPFGWALGIGLGASGITGALSLVALSQLTNFTSRFNRITALLRRPFAFLYG